MARYLSYMTTKWLCFYLYQYLGSGRSWHWDKVETKEDIFYTAWMLFALPVLEIFLLALPTHLAIRQTGWLMMLALVFTFALEFAIGWYATNQHLSTWMIVKIILSVGLLVLFYRKLLVFKL